MCFSQANDSLSIVCDSFYTFVDEEAEFPRGKIELKKFISQNIEYPEGLELENLPIGKIYLNFIVLNNGTIAQTDIENGMSNEWNKVAMDLIQKMPNWIPAQINGVPVCSEIRYPIFITLN